MTDKTDFDANLIYVTFPADEDEVVATYQVDADIPIIDDDIDENLYQYFAAKVELANNTDSRESNFTVCKIIDNEESKLVITMKIPWSTCPYVGCRIGYRQRLYEFLEPENREPFTNVTLMKENSCHTERTYAVGVSAVESSSSNITAARSSEYYLGSPEDKYVTVTLLPTEVAVTVPLNIAPDHLPERMEGFQLSSTTVEGFPRFKAPTTLYQQTEIIITDNDSTYNNYCMSVHKCANSIALLY